MGFMDSKNFMVVGMREKRGIFYSWFFGKFFFS